MKYNIISFINVLLLFIGVIEKLNVKRHLLNMQVDVSYDISMEG